MIVVHVQQEEDRQFYALERLWADAPLIEVPDSEAPAAQSDSPASSSPALTPEPVSPLDLIGEDFS